MTLDKWNEFLLRLPRPHILQTLEWSEQKKEIGWQAEPLMINDQGWQPDSWCAHINPDY